MKKNLTAAITAASLALAGVVLTAPAVHATEPENCTESPAWVEVVPNPDYLPEIAEQTETVEHPAVTIDHAAVTVEHAEIPETTTVTGHVKWVWNGGRTDTAPAFTAQSPWNLTSDNRPNKHDPLGVVYKTGNGKNASWAIYVEQTRTTPGVPAWTETITEAWTEIITEAWTETVVTVPYQPATGAPTLEIHHPATICPPPAEEPEEPEEPAEEPEEPVTTPTEPTKPATPVTQEATDAPQATAKDELAFTGSQDLTAPATIGALALIAGLALARRRANKIGVRP